MRSSLFLVSAFPVLPALSSHGPVHHHVARAQVTAAAAGNLTTTTVPAVPKPSVPASSNGTASSIKAASSPKAPSSSSSVDRSSGSSGSSSGGSSGSYSGSSGSSGSSSDGSGSYSGSSSGSSVQYGSGSQHVWNTLDECIVACEAEFGQSSSSGSSYSYSSSDSSYYSPLSTIMSTSSWQSGGYVAQHGETYLEPYKGNHRFMPWAMDWNQGSSINFNWGGSGHSVTQSSSSNACSAFSGGYNSGSQNSGYKTSYKVSSSSPSWFYSSESGACQDGMFFLINPARTTDISSSFSSYMDSMRKSDSSFSTLYDQTTKMCAGNSDAGSWGAMFDISQIPSSSRGAAMYNTLATRQYYMSNPSVLAAIAGARLNAVSNTTAGASASATPTPVSAKASGASISAPASAVAMVLALAASALISA